MTLKLSLLSAALLSTASYAAKPSLEFKDVFDFRYPHGTQVSEQGELLSFSAKPYRGNSEGHVYNLITKQRIATVPRGTKPTINKSGQWVAFTQQPTLLAQETASKKDKKALKNDLVLVNANTEKQQTFTAVKDYQLSDDGNWLVYREDKASEPAEETSENAAISADKGDTALPLVVVNLATNTRQTIADVASYQLAPNSQAILLAQHSHDGSQNRVVYMDLTNGSQANLIEEPGVTLADIAWQPSGEHVAFYLGNYVNEDKRRRDYQLTLWAPKSNQLRNIENPPQWFSGKTAKLSWSDDGTRLFFENRPVLDAKQPELKYQDRASLYDYDTIRDQKGLKVWHNQDPEIKPREAKTWQQSRRDQHFQAVYHLEGQQVVQLESPTMPYVAFNKNADYLLGSNDQPYLEQILYKGFYRDYYATNVQTGERQLIVKASPNRPTLSPSGQHAAFFKNGQVWLKSLPNQKLTAVSQAVKTAIFADDKHDRPEPNDGYGFAGWQADGSILYAYSKYDIWAFDTQTHQATRLTDGYKTQTQYRLGYQDNEQLGFNKSDTLVLHGHNLNNKQTHVATLSLATGKLESRLTGEAKFTIVTKAKESDTYLFTKQTDHQCTN